MRWHYAIRCRFRPVPDGRDGHHAGRGRVHGQPDSVFDTGRGLVPRPEAGLNQRGPGKPGPTNPLMQLDGAGDSCDEALTYLEETVGDAASDNSAPPDVWTQPTLRGGHPARAAVPDPGADVAGDQRARRLPCASGQCVRGGLPRQDGRHDT